MKMQHPKKKKSNWSNLGSVILNTLNILRNKYLPSIAVYDTNKRSRGLLLLSSRLHSNVPRMGVKGRETQVPLRVTRQVMALESQGQKWLIYSWETWPNSATLSDNYRKSPKEQKTRETCFVFQDFFQMKSSRILRVIIWPPCVNMQDHVAEEPRVLGIWNIKNSIMSDF